MSANGDGRNSQRGPMPIHGWTETIAQRVEVTQDKVVLDLVRNGKPIDRFTVYKSGRIEPEPSDPAAKELLSKQAAALRGELETRLQWGEGADGWLALNYEGYSIMVRRASAHQFQAIIDGNKQTLNIFPDDIEVAKRALEGLILQLAKRK